MTLPPEVLFRILDVLGLDVPVLKAASLTNKFLSFHCQRRLFVNASFRINLDKVTGDSKGDPQIDRFIQALTERRQLKGFVKSLTIVIGSIDPGRFEEGFAQALCPLLGELPLLERLSISGENPTWNLRHTSPRPFQSICSTKLSSLSISGVSMDIPFSWVYSQRDLKEVTLEYAAFRLNKTVGMTPFNAGSVQLEKLGYRIGCRLPAARLRNVIDPDDHSTCGFSVERLQHFEFGSLIGDDHLVAIWILSKAAYELRTFQYFIPPGSSGGNHARINNNVFDQINYSVFTSLISLQHVTIQLPAGGCSEDLAYRGEEWQSITSWAVDACQVLTACPVLSKLEIQLVKMYSSHLFSALDKSWVVLDEILGAGCIPSLRSLKISLNLSVWWGGTDGGDASLERQLQGTVDRIFSKTRERGIKLEVNISWDETSACYEC